MRREGARGRASATRGRARASQYGACEARPSSQGAQGPFGVVHSGAGQGALPRTRAARVSLGRALGSTRESSLLRGEPP